MGFTTKKRSNLKIGLGKSVLDAAKERIAWVFDTFPNIYLSGPSGKDSGAMMHLVCEEARRRSKRVGVLYVDLEAQYKVTIEHIHEMFHLYSDCIDPYWLAIPINLRNSVSMANPYWVAWDPTKKDLWVRSLPEMAISDGSRFPFYRAPWEGNSGNLCAMEFEELVSEFGNWYGNGGATACFVGIRSDESLNRWRTIAGLKSNFEGRQWTSWKGESVYNIYPIYDWATEDIWTYFGRTKLPYNKLYDMMYKAGVPLSQQRICQPYGDDQRRGLWLYHVIEPESWGKVVARVSGANQGALYAGKRGNILGNGAITLPTSHTSWQSYVRFLLDSLPVIEAEHYRDKISIFCKWWEERGYSQGIPDESDLKLESAKKVPSWRRIAKVILRNDRLCKGLSFAQTSSNPLAYEKYKKVMKARRSRWGNLGV